MDIKVFLNKKTHYKILFTQNMEILFQSHNTSRFNIFHRLNQKLELGVRNRISSDESLLANETVSVTLQSKARASAVLHGFLCLKLYYFQVFLVCFFKVLIILLFSHFTFTFLVSSLATYYQRPRKNFSYLYVLTFLK